MAIGYLVTLGDGFLDSGDAISATQSNFTISGTAIGTGSWVWTGTYGGVTYSNIPDTGTYYLGTDGNVYFQPTNYYTTSGTAKVEAHPQYPPSDGVITGTTGNDLINEDYNNDAQHDRVTRGNDSISAGSGNDTVHASDGNDTIDGGAGNDVIDGEGGNDSILGGIGDDLIHGDNITTPDRIAFQWSDMPDPQDSSSIDAGDSLTSGTTMNVGGVNVTYVYTANPTGTTDGTGGTDTAPIFSGSQTNTAGINDGASTADGYSSALFGGDFATSQISLNFDTAVTNVSFNINDIDYAVTNGAGFRDSATVRAYDANGNLIPVTITYGSALTASNTDTMAGNDRGTSTNLSTSGTDPRATMNVSIAGPVSSIVIIYQDTYGTGDDGLIEVTDVWFDEPASSIGNDTIDGGAGNDVIYGDGGNDIIQGGTGSDSLFGGDGNDIINDSGTTSDYIDGGAGNDTITAGAGSDTVYGGIGIDSIFGNDGDDLMYGGAGDDMVDGDAGNDRLYGDAGNDVIVGDSGNDTMFGGTGDDGIYASDGNNTAYGDAGNDSIYMGTGNDTIYGGDNNDTIYGGAGNDMIRGDAGSDSMTGGLGNDTFVLGNSFGVDNIDGSEDTGNGDVDVLDASTMTTGVTVTKTGAESGTLTSGTNTATFSNIEAIVTGSGADSIIGSTGNDTITTGAGADRVNAGAGNDTINLGVGTATDGAADVVVLQDGSGNDIISGFDAPTGSGTSFTGVDKLDVSNLYDLPAGDPNRTPVRTNDVVVSDDGSGNAVLTFPNGESVTLIGISPTAAANPFYLNAIGIPMPDGTVSGTAGDDLINGSYTGDTDGDVVDGNDAILTGDTGNDDLIYGYGGNDTISAGNGNDEAFGGTGNDIISGGAGNDTLYGGDGNDSITGDTGHDTLYGNDGSDVLNGGAGNDTLYGGNNNDTITMGAGNDVAYGESGDDTFIVQDGFGTDTITGGETGETIGDTLDLSATTTNLTLNLTSANGEAGSFTDGLGNGTTFSEIETIILGGGNDTIVLNNTSGDYTIAQFEAPTANTDGTFTGTDTLNVTGLFDLNTNPVNVHDVTVSDDGNGNAVLSFPGGESLTLIGISPIDADNIFYLNAIGIPMSDGTVSGTAGNDIINAAYIGDPDGDRVDGNDAILSGHTANDDLIEAGAGNDSIYTGSGNNTVYAGSGNDQIYAGSGSNNTIYGEAGDDNIIGNSGSDTAFGGTGNDVIYGFAGDDSIDGGTGNDTLNGGDGADTMAGDDDADSFVLEAGFGADTITGGEGGLDSDTIVSTQGVDTTTIFIGDEAGTFSDGTSTATFSEIEVLDLQSGNDMVDASASNASVTVYGGSGDDIITGGTGNDDIFGGNGADVLEGGAGDDTIDGGAGDDSIIILDGFGNDTIVGGESTELFGDLLLGNKLTQNTTVVFTGAEAGTLSMGGDTLTFSEIEGVVLGSGDDSVIGSAGNDMIATEAGSDTVNAGAGDDLIALGPNDLDADLVILQNGSGNDIIYDFDAPIDNLDGTFTGIDKLDVTNMLDLGGSPVNTNDVVVSDDGNGNALLTFPSGDTVVLNGISPTEADNPFYLNAIGIPMSDGTVEGTSGDDIIDASYTGDPDGDMVDGNDAILTGDTGNDDLIYGYDGNDSIYAGDGNDEVYGGTGNDLLQTGLGDDTVYGGDGNDSVYAENGNDTVYGGAGDDVVGASIGNDLVYGGDGNDTINGGGWSYEGDTLFGDAGNDSISGDAGNDTLYGGADDDILVGNIDDDLIYGGTGNDTIVVGDNHGTDVIEGGEDTSGLDNDTLDLNDLSTTGGTNVTLTGNEAGTYDFNNAAATGTFTEIETFDLTDSADTFDGAAATSNTTVLAGAGNDVITTGSGDDSIAAGAGDDLIDGGAGTDSIDGGTGNDTFVLNENSGVDTIVGGENAGDTDTLSFQGATFGAGANVTFTGDESGTYLVDGSSVAGPDATGSFSEIEAIVGTATSDYVNASASNASVTISGEGGFDILTGGSADDVIYGGDGGDLLTGGAGADSLIGDAGNDVITFSEGDTVAGGTGDDTFVAEDLGEPTNGTITVTGGSGGETTRLGDTLQLGGLADLSTLVKISDGINADGNETFHGSVTMDDGTILNFSEIENIICFTPGTRIATPKGARDIATLRVGDLVVTRDHGLQPIRWIQSRTVPALENFAPIRIRPGVVTGQERDLLVSPQHRMMFQGYRAELLFGESEVLIAAKHLVDGRLVTQDAGGNVTYIHMMFDEHEVVYAEGAATESFHPGDVGLTAISDPARDELFALFPELRTNVNGYGQTARRCLKRHEADLLIV